MAIDKTLSVEELAATIEGLVSGPGAERNAYSIWPQRLHLARNSAGAVELFIEGSRESFGPSALGRSLEHGLYREAKGAREFFAIVIRSGSQPEWTRPMAHLSYEAVQLLTQQPNVTNEELLVRVAPYLALVIERSLLSTEQQLGLTAELIFLQELLAEANALGVPSEAAIDRWTGWESASRDFKGGPIAVEAKATGADARHHWVHPMQQLLSESTTEEKVYVFSVGLKVDRSRDFKLTVAVQRVLEILPTGLGERFLGLAGQYLGIGFDSTQWRQYELEPGFLVSHTPALFRVDHLTDILRPEAFRGNTPPARVIDLSYRVSLEMLPAAGNEERRQVLETILRG